MKDFYKILGVKEDATQDQIKKAYRKLSIKWHPDKHNNENEQKKKEASEKFTEINEANDVLSDPEKRKQYDLERKFGARPHPGFGFNNWGMRQQRPQRKVYPPGSDVNIVLRLSIEDLFNYDKPKILSYNRLVRCDECAGSGGKGNTTCTHCEGTGTISEVRVQGNMQFVNQYTCPYCHGTGEIVKETCEKCNGTGLKNSINEIDVNEVIPREYLYNNNIRVTLSADGNESRSPEMPNGSLNVGILHEFNQNEYRLDSQGNIIQLVQVPYYDCILGSDMFTFIACDRGYHSVVLPKGTQGGTKIECKELHGAGPNTKYYIWVKVEIPKEISDEVKNKLEEIRNIVCKK